jgi:transcriptional regulator with XRE-family HTH domain
VASRAAVALGYLSEIERGQKEASSEILASVAYALDVPISKIMHLVAERFEAVETVIIPDTVPTEFVTNFDSSSLANSR